MVRPPGTPYPVVIAVHDRGGYSDEQAALAILIAHVLDRGIFVLCEEPEGEDGP